jgi:hypothetical protein
MLEKFKIGGEKVHLAEVKSTISEMKNAAEATVYSKKVPGSLY